ncbi:hypothetical protein MRB53_008540 [Persea americana]|uniref:Uncharacterized protein n=1 Tax=Persea americana TaxID=3435 RepID=A0ACC2MM45_PERAE|nr:hypothetical protein MRB53_008540 [Persea americana]
MNARTFVAAIVPASGPLALNGLRPKREEQRWTTPRRHRCGAARCSITGRREGRANSPTIPRVVTDSSFSIILVGLHLAREFLFLLFLIFPTGRNWSVTLIHVICGALSGDGPPLLGFRMDLLGVFVHSLFFLFNESYFLTEGSESDLVGKTGEHSYTMRQKLRRWEIVAAPNNSGKGAGPVSTNF